MYDYRYVTKNEAKPYKEKIIELLNLIQDEVRDQFTFKYTPVGSSSPNRNMITCLTNGNIGFDFDYNIEPNLSDGNSPDKVRKVIYDGLKKYALRFGYTKVENSTSVITIKVIEHRRKRILYSCDFAIVHNYEGDDGTIKQEYIRFNKEHQTYSWQDRGKGFYIEHKIEWLKKNGYWNDLRCYYIEKKNYNEDPNKHSRSLLAEAVNERYHKYHG